MLTMSASDVRKDWSRVIDSVIHERPAFIKRTRDHMLLCSTDMAFELVKSINFIVNKYDEDDGSVTLSLKDIDIIANGVDLDTAKSTIVENLIEYAEDYYREFDMYIHTPNRRGHLPYIIKILTAKSPEELKESVVCQDGET